jgi:hypothetical protein
MTVRSGERIGIHFTGHPASSRRSPMHAVDDSQYQRITGNGNQRNQVIVKSRFHGVQLLSASVDAE